MNLFDKLKLIFKLNSIIRTEIKEIKTMDIKSGWKTSEFWGKVAVQAGVIWAAVGQFIPPKYAAVIVALAEGSYLIGRTVLKMVQAVQAAKQDTTPVTTTSAVTTVTTPS